MSVAVGASGRARVKARSGRAAALLVAVGTGLGACGAGDGVPCTEEVCSAHVVVDVDHPLSAVLSFETGSRVEPIVTVEAPSGAWQVPRTGFLTPLPGVRHEVAIVGLAAQRSYRLHVSVGGGPGVQVEHTSGALPADLPPVELRAGSGASADPSFTVFPVGTGIESVQGFVLAVDHEGEIVWYDREAPDLPMTMGSARTRAGTLLVTRGSVPRIVPATAEIVEIDVLGREVGVWPAPAPDVYHHDVVELPNGNLLALRSEARDVSGYPGGSGRSTYRVVGDVLVELTRTGEVVHELRLLDVLDPYRTPSIEFASALYDPVYGARTRDWSHANGIVHLPENDHVILSVRNQSLVVELERRSGRIVWALGEDRAETNGDDAWPFLRLVGPGRLPSHQHAPAWRDDGHLLLYDNGNYRGGTPQTRVVEYAIDAERLEVREVWSWSDPDYDPPLYAPLVGDADRLADGTVLVTDGGLWDHAPFGLHWARIVEVRPEDGTKVWELVMRDDVHRTAITGYDAIRVPSLYPPE